MEDSPLAFVPNVLTMKPRKQPCETGQIDNVTITNDSGATQTLAPGGTIDPGQTRYECLDVPGKFIFHVAGSTAKLKAKIVS